MEYRRYFGQAIDRLKAERRYRVFADLERDASRFPIALWHTDKEPSPREVVIWCSNDYLGMGRHPKVIEAMRAGTIDFTVTNGTVTSVTGSGSSYTVTVTVTDSTGNSSTQQIQIEYLGPLQ